jgi:aryl-alcohol dehydrogenase-like predicted oxidoreductase
MRYRALGNTGLQVSELGFGCGAVGGILVRGEYRDMVRAVARAVELGLTYFDTASLYGNGLSEANLGRVLQELGAPVVVGTKVRLRAAELEDIEGAVMASVEGSLKRLQRDRVDLIQLHNALFLERQPSGDGVGMRDLEPILNAFRRLRTQGKVRFWGLNGLGETEALLQAVGSAEAATMQCCFNLLNPSAGYAAPPGFPFQDYRQLLDRAAARGMGVIAIRVLAGGALSGTAERHVVAEQHVAPIATSADFAGDVARAQRFLPLITAGYADSLSEAAIRFALSKPGISTALVGLSSLDQLEEAARAAARGPLPAEALALLPEVWGRL